MTVRSYRELIAWQKAMDLVQVIYVTTKDFPAQERYGLASQVCRAAVSVPSNIAEGQGRRSTKEFKHHLSMAYGSLCEVETQILIAHRLAYLGDDQASGLLTQSAEVGRLINGLANSLPQSRPTDH